MISNVFLFFGSCEMDYWQTANWQSLKKDLEFVLTVTATIWISMHVAFAVLIFFLWGDGHRHFNEKNCYTCFTVLTVWLEGESYYA